MKSDPRIREVASDKEWDEFYISGDAGPRYGNYDVIVDEKMARHLLRPDSGFWRSVSGVSVQRRRVRKVLTDWSTVLVEELQDETTSNEGDG